MTLNLFVLLCLISFYVKDIQAQSGTQISVSVNTGTGLVYLLLVVFFLVNFLTPVARWIYVNYLETVMDKAQKDLARMQKKFSERLSDAQRKVSQSLRT